jgi:hypothetical protein
MHNPRQRDATTATSMATNSSNAQQPPSVATVQQHTKLGTAKEQTQLSVQPTIERIELQTQDAQSTLRKESG